MPGYQKPSSSSKRQHDDNGDEEPGSKKSKDDKEGVSNMSGEKANQWKSFWVPELSTSAEADRAEKPVSV
jgi:hypothetical protein